MTRHEWSVAVSRRADGTPWPVRFISHVGDAGPATAIVTGVYGDKAMGPLAVQQLDRELSSMRRLRGEVILVPAANMPALEAGTRVNPDHFFLNRRYPGSDAGFLTDQIANAIFTVLRDRVDVIIDLHSGTPSMGLWYSYADAADTDLSAAFGYLPLCPAPGHSGTLSGAAASVGIRSFIPEFGGGVMKDLTPGVQGSLNVLKYRGQIPGLLTGPKRLPVIGERPLFLSSVHGILIGEVDTKDVGKPVGPGLLGRVVSTSTGDVLEEYRIDRQGLLMMATTTPAVVQPGSFAFMVGYVERHKNVPPRLE